MEPFSDSDLDSRQGEVTFIGGTADLGDPPRVLCEPMPAASLPEQQLPLAMTAVGDRVWVVQIKGGKSLVRRLKDVGLVPGNEISIVSRTESGSVILALQGCRIGLGAGMAHRVMVTIVAPVGHSATTHQPLKQSVSGGDAMPTTLHLGALEVGQSGRIVGYEKGSRTYRERLLSMGLTPGTNFSLTRQAPMGDPIEIEVRGFKLSLRKGEAAALKVETIPAEEIRHD